MLSRIPANYRQSFKWLGNLDAVSAAFLGGGVMVAIKVVMDHASWAVKGPEIVVALALGGIFGLVRWPLDIAGDRTVTWLMRYVNFARRTKHYSYFEGMIRLPRRSRN